jgi:hypothetical protein
MKRTYIFWQNPPGVANEDGVKQCGEFDEFETW